ncbi:uncharacterized protein NECHADRAFT_39497 [Fusarium vanettenii 77-13-4]|uniref:Hydantoinase/oxoprolinase n=1 Tax=Fusarium vanettenii (strain ATCC MYA-4622 / CBS 123669 / FGSC 9596 / NRRL 45880 / 77-13-4) TaxID=660122 RepID=C7Z8C6_FUSV7|nr:uncharacterized protein NECHADRAFT_39497 [Fusarium vanettenii 77-13-4]EEU39845.1 hypothetical protein NECHADRAFT_39497 [Fusarium vanettenii 77-13-4]
MSPSRIEEQTATYRIGVDVGGTNTDAVLVSLDPVSILASHKAPTTADITTGITNAVRTVIDASGVSLSSIGCVVIGTTHFVNAVVQRSATLQRVSVVRLCGGPNEGFGRDLPPFIDFPADLRNKIEAPSYFCHGGYQISGEEISPLDEAEIEHVAELLVEAGETNIVISGMYSPMNHTQESHAAEILMERMTELKGGKLKPRITMSHQVSQLGFLARENAAILNATLRPLAEQTIRGFQTAIRDIFKNEPCVLYLTQNDGSVLKAADAIELPIRTFNSGPTNSIRGGEFLWRAAMESEGNGKANREDALVVVDIGGTTSDSGLLLANGLPMMSSVTSFVGGVRTNFALPAVESIGLGGGSIVRDLGNGELTVGPDSVALELLTKAKVFGGDYLTSSDIAVASDPQKNPFKAVGGDIDRLSGVPKELLDRAQVMMRQSLEQLIDRTKIQKGAVDVLIVGGGALIVDTKQEWNGVRAIRTVQGGEVANAVGAAISRVSAVVDTVVDTTHQTVKQAQEKVRALAIEKTMSQGAKKETVDVAEFTILPIQYADGKARIIARAIGELDVVVATSATNETIDDFEEDLETSTQATKTTTTRNGKEVAIEEPVDVQTYSPTIKGREWIISATDLEFIAAGCKVLGCGGGGDPYQEYLKAKSILASAPGSVRVVSPSDLPEDSLVGWTACIGSPEVSMERLENNECLQAHEELIRATGSPEVSGFLAAEIGGGNGVVNLGVSAQKGVPCLDADLMGRAYPTMWQLTFNVYGSSKGDALVPTTIASGDGTVVTMTETRTDKMVDKTLRAACVVMGCRAGNAGPPKTAKLVQEQAVSNTVSLAWWIGYAVATQKSIEDKMRSIIDAVGGPASACVLAEGKITSVERVLKTGHTYGVLEVDGALSDGTKAVIKVPFKNENAYVEAVLADGSTSILAAVPDLIAVIDSETGIGLGTPEYKYGLRVIILAMAASPRWTDSERGMELGGPGSMGFERIEYKPIGQYKQPRSVIDAFAR